MSLTTRGLLLLGSSTPKRAGDVSRSSAVPWAGTIRINQVQRGAGTLEQVGGANAHHFKMLMNL